MSKELHIALQEAIGDLGTDVLKSPFLVNILQDYGAFDVHDVNRAKTKTIIELFSKEEYGEKFIAWRNNREKKLQKQLNECIDNLYSKVDDISIDMVVGVIEEITIALGMPFQKEMITKHKATQVDEKKQPTSTIDNQIFSIWEKKLSDYYGKAHGASFNEAAYIGDRIANGQESIIRELKRSNYEKVTEKTIVQLFLKEATTAANSIYSTASIFHSSLNSLGKRQYGDRFLRASAAGISINYALGDILENEFGNAYSEECVSSWKNGIRLHSKLAPYLADISLNISIIAKYEGKIKKYNPTYKSPKYDTDPSSLNADEGGCSTVLIVFLIIAVLGFFVALVNGEL